MNGADVGEIVRLGKGLKPAAIAKLEFETCPELAAETNAVVGVVDVRFKWVRTGPERRAMRVKCAVAVEAIKASA